MKQHTKSLLYVARSRKGLSRRMRTMLAKDFRQERRADKVGVRKYSALKLKGPYRSR